MISASHFKAYPKLPLALVVAAATFASALLAPLHAGQPALLNVSYDVTREFYRDFNEAFAKEWKSKTGQAVTINQSHGGSSKQARSVLDGLQADVVTMNQATDLTILADAGLVAADWVDRFPHRASPYTSTIVFLVRKGNPKSIQDWPDLIKAGVQVILPNPKTSGNGRYSYLAAWAYAKNAPGGSDEKAKDFVRRLLKNVPVLDTGGRGATTTFAQRGIGDVLLTFENEAWLATKELGQEQLEIVLPPTSILAEAPVAVVEKWAAKHGTEALAKAYLSALYSPLGQSLAAKHYLRPRDEGVLKEFAKQFPPLKTYTVETDFGGWSNAQKTHFGDGGTFDGVYFK